jgi:hypothetical protein
MRANRVLVAKGWYWVSTDVNNRERVFRLPRAVLMLREVLCDARKIYEFDGRFNLECGRYGHVNKADIPTVKRGDWRREAERIGFQPRCGKRRCCRTCHGRVGQTLAMEGGGKPCVPAGVSG